MSSNSNIAIDVVNLQKVFHIYENPSQRLKQFFFPKLFSIIGKKSQYFREYEVLKNINLQVKKGECLGILGRNGSGKSTLLQIICGTLSPTSGQVTTSGRITALLELGSGFNPEFTGKENVYINGSILGLKKEEIDSKYNDIVEFADIGEFIDQPLKTYSSGMIVRLAFSVQAHIDPDILIVDEALAVGDVFFQQKCVKFMKEKLHETTKILVTHDMHAIYNFCDKVIVLEQGKIAFAGDVKEGVEFYLKNSHGRINNNEVLLNASDDSNEKAVFQRINPADMGGAGNIIITHFAIKVDDKTIQNNSINIFHDDDVEISAKIKINKNNKGIVFGYLISDRNGMHVCGDNKVLSELNDSIDEGGDYVINLKFKWPNISSGFYTLTLGVGSGDDSLAHAIECWAHSIFAFECVTTVPVHGIFTNKLLKFSIEKNELF